MASKNSSLEHVLLPREDRRGGHIKGVARQLLDDPQPPLLTLLLLQRVP